MMSSANHNATWYRAFSRVGRHAQANALEAHVRDLVCGMLADPETRAALATLGDEGDDHSLVEELRGVEAKRQRLIELYTDGDIDRAQFRSRRDDLDERARTIEAEMAYRSGNRVLTQVPASYEDLISAWDKRGVEFQRRLTEALLHPIVVKPAGVRRRRFDPDRLVIEPRA